MEKYRPSSGTEAMDFMDIFCCRCYLDPGDGLGCDIANRAMCCASSDDSEYPIEWTYDEKGRPICTSFKEYCDMVIKKIEQERSQSYRGLPPPEKR